MEAKIYGYDPTSIRYKESRAICPSGSIVDRLSIYSNKDEKKMQGMEIICNSGKKYNIGNHNENMEKLEHNCRDLGYTKLDVFEDGVSNPNLKTIYGMGMYCQKDDLLLLKDKPKDENYPKYYTKSNHPENAVKNEFNCPEDKKLIGMASLTNKHGIDTVQLICEGDNVGTALDTITNDRVVYDMQTKYWYFLMAILFLGLLIFWMLGLLNGFDPFGSKRLGRN